MAKKAILLTNLGSPDSPKVSDVRRYLNQFLMDPYVIDKPYLLRALVVKCFILPFRPKKSAEAYQKIWLEEGSPLVVTTRQLTEEYQKRTSLPVSFSMRYGNPSTNSVILKLKKENPDLEELVVVPLYPHYAMSSVKTAIEDVKKVVKKNKLNLKLTIIPPFYRHPRYIDALIKSINPYIHKINEQSHLLFSYHGLPVRHLVKTDQTKKHCQKVSNCCITPSDAHKYCYSAQCFQTTKEMVKRLMLQPEQFSVSFQSRLGRDPWIEPFTDEVIVNLAKKGIKNLFIICPAFVSDCLETIEEIGMEAKEIFIENGGHSLTLIPCLNAEVYWVEALMDIVSEKMVLD